MEKQQHTNYMVLGLTLLKFDPTIYRTWGEHFYNNTVDAIPLTVQYTRDRRGRDRMVVGFTTTYAISVYHHWCCPRSSNLDQGEVYNIMR